MDDTSAVEPAPRRGICAPDTPAFELYGAALGQGGAAAYGGRVSPRTTKLDPDAAAAFSIRCHRASDVPVAFVKRYNASQGRSRGPANGNVSTQAADHRPTH